MRAATTPTAATVAALGVALGLGGIPLAACGPQGSIAIDNGSSHSVRVELTDDWVEEFEPDSGGVFPRDGCITGPVIVTVIGAEDAEFVVNGPLCLDQQLRITETGVKISRQ